MQEEERRRLARELHDTTGQNIAALQMNLSMLVESVRMLDPRARQALSDSVRLAQTCVREIRSLSYALYPPMLDEAGLVAALQAYGEIPGLDLPDQMDRLPHEVELALFRMVQESRATAVRLSRKRDSVVLELTGYRGPVAGIRERARLLGGQLRVTSTKLRVSLPVPTASPAGSRRSKSTDQAAARQSR